MTIIKAGIVHFLITLVFFILVKGAVGLTFTGVGVSSPITNIALPIWKFIMHPLAWFDSVEYLMQGTGYRGRRGIFTVMIANSFIWGLAIAGMLRVVEHIKDRRYSAY